MDLSSKDNEVFSMNDIMEKLRKNNVNVKSFEEISNLLQVASSQQSTRSMLRSCMDKVLINMSNIQSLRDILDRLRSVARTNGLRFNLPLDKESTGPETTCEILGDMFRIEIILGAGESHYGGPSVLDVKVNHSEQAVSSSQLVEMIRKGNFIGFSNLLRQLVQMYPMSLERNARLRVLLALQSLEVDINKMSSIYKDSHRDCSTTQIVMHGAVGLISKRVVGKSTRLNYFLSPYDLIDPTNKKIITSFDYMPDDCGLHGEIGVEAQTSSCRLPIAPLISSNHPIDSTGLARFAEVNQHNSVVLPACFVLRLKPAIPLLLQIAKQIERETNIQMNPNTEEIQPFITLFKDEKDCFEVMCGGYRLRFHFDFDGYRGFAVSKICFSHPKQLVVILNYLRKQAYFNSIVQSCVRQKKKFDSHKQDWYFDVSINDDLTSINVTFEHPLSVSSTAFAQIQISTNGFESCKLFTGRGDIPLCSNKYATKLMQTTFSLPITMMKIVQTRPDPSKLAEMRAKGSTPAASQHLRRPPPPQLQQKPQPHKQQPQLPQQHTQLQPQQKQQQQQQKNFSQQQAPAGARYNNLLVSHVKISPHNSFTTTSATHIGSEEEGVVAPAKALQHPMLTQLLKPNSDVNMATRPAAASVQTEKHPMLLNLLAESSSSEVVPVSNVMTTMHDAAGFQHQLKQPNFQPQYEPADAYFIRNSQPTSSYMPPPPSYTSSIQMQMKTHQQIQQQLQYPPQASPVATLDELPSPLQHSLASPMYTNQPMTSSTPTLISQVGMSPVNPAMSPMYAVPSPKFPPMNTPQPAPSPLQQQQMGMMMSPAPGSGGGGRRMSGSGGGRRTSRHKSSSTDDPSEITFGSTQFGMVESDQASSAEILNTQQTSSLQNSFMPVRPHHPLAPTLSVSAMSGHSNSDSRLNSLPCSTPGATEMAARRDSVSRTVSNPSFISPPSSAGPLHDNQDIQHFPISSSLSGGGSEQNILHHSNATSNFQSVISSQSQQQILSLKSSQKPSAAEQQAQFVNAQQLQQQQHQRAQQHKLSEQQQQMSEVMFSRSVDSYQLQQQRESEMSERVVDSSADSDPFTFDDNRTPSKISMPDSGSVMSQERNKISRSDSMSGGLCDSTLKGLYQTSPGLMSVLTGSSNPPHQKLTANLKSEKSPMLQNLVALGPSDQRKTSGISGQETTGGHKQLVRQNAIAKGTTQSFSQKSQMAGAQGYKSDVKAKKKSGGNSEKSSAPKRRGRPPLSDKKDHSVKRKKTDTSEDSETTRGKIVLNVQLAKGMPVSSTTKTKPVPQQDEQPASNASSQNPPQHSSNNNSSATSSPMTSSAATSSLVSGAVDDPTDLLQRYLKSQNEMSIRKKEKKMMSRQPLSSSLQHPQIMKGSLKSTSGGNQSSTGNYVRSQLSTTSNSKNTPSPSSVAGTASKPASTAAQPKAASSASNVQQQQKAAARSRKNSLKEVVDKLSFKAEHSVVVPAKSTGQISTALPKTPCQATGPPPKSSGQSTGPHKPSLGTAATGVVKSSSQIPGPAKSSGQVSSPPKLSSQVPFKVTAQVTSPPKSSAPAGATPRSASQSPASSTSRSSTPSLSGVNKLSSSKSSVGKVNAGSATGSKVQPKASSQSPSHSSGKSSSASGNRPSPPVKLTKPRPSSAQAQLASKSTSKSPTPTKSPPKTPLPTGIVVDAKVKHSLNREKTGPVVNMTVDNPLVSKQVSRSKSPARSMTPPQRASQQQQQQQPPSQKEGTLHSLLRNKPSSNPSALESPASQQQPAQSPVISRASTPVPPPSRKTSSPFQLTSPPAKKSTEASEPAHQTAAMRLLAPPVVAQSTAASPQSPGESALVIDDVSAPAANPSSRSLTPSSLSSVSHTSTSPASATKFQPIKSDSTKPASSSSSPATTSSTTAPTLQASNTKSSLLASTPQQLGDSVGGMLDSPCEIDDELFDAAVS